MLKINGEGGVCELFDRCFR